MAIYGRPSLRDIFDDSPTPHIAHPPHTHHRDYYVATDGSYRTSGSGLGVIIESRDGECFLRLAVPDDAPDNNVAEYRALHLGLDALAEHAPPTARVGVLVDHNELAGNVNAMVLGTRHPDWTAPYLVTVPDASEPNWRGIRARISSFEDLRAARIPSDQNPAHVLANAPDKYAHVNEKPTWCPLPDHSRPTDDAEIPPPSRANRNRQAGD